MMQFAIGHALMNKYISHLNLLCGFLVLHAFLIERCPKCTVFEALPSPLEQGKQLPPCFPQSIRRVTSLYIYNQGLIHDKISIKRSIQLTDKPPNTFQIAAKSKRIYS